jgi:hypothetical protein
MLRVIRWLLILPGAVAAWYAALILGIGLYKSVDALCPFGQVEFGRCLAPWFMDASDVFIGIGAALAALLVMVTCTFLAPTHRRHVAIATFVVGAITAIIMGWESFANATIAAIVSGGVVLGMLLWRMAPLSLPNTSLERTPER